MRSEYFTVRSGAFDLAAVVDWPDARPAPVPAVICCHGFTGNRFETRRLYVLLAQRLTKLGIAVMRFDHRGCGESSGDFIDFTAEGLLEDLDAALGAFIALPGVDTSRTGLMGYSLGGASCSYLMHRRPGFVCASYWAPVARPDIIRERFETTYPDFSGTAERGYFDYFGFRVNARYFETVGQVLRPLDWAAGFRGPVLFLHGDADEIVRPDQSRQYAERRAHPGDHLEFLAGADHGFTDSGTIGLLLEKTAAWHSRQLL